MEKRPILVYLETEEDQILKVSLEALKAGLQLKDQTGCDIVAIVIDGESSVTANYAASYGVTEVVSVTASCYQPELFSDILFNIFKRYDTSYLIMGSTRNGKELAAHVASRIRGACVTDAMALTEENCWVRSVYGGSLLETVSTGERAVITVRSGTFGKPVQDTSLTATIIKMQDLPMSQTRMLIKETVKELSENVNLEDAEIIVSGGRGMGSAENFKLVYQLAQVLGGVVGASRPAIEDGWVPRNHQVGQSGKIVAPKLYIACGISGAMQHVSGMSGSGYIVAINKDEDAPIFDVSDVGIVGNVTEIIPLMIEEIKKMKN